MNIELQLLIIPIVIAGTDKERPGCSKIRKYLTNIKQCFHIDIQLYQHEWKLGKREIVWKHDTRRAECFDSHNCEFSQFPRVLI